eukprot:scaffold31187_cov49-Cyclotella_meneghiniana.AAC.2
MSFGPTTPSWTILRQVRAIDLTATRSAERQWWHSYCNIKRAQSILAQVHRQLACSPSFDIALVSAAIHVDQLQDGEAIAIVLAIPSSSLALVVFAVFTTSLPVLLSRLFKAVIYDSYREVTVP